jgi:anti-sigma regulatory factor (Ser/Thr protein kinase)
VTRRFERKASEVAGARRFVRACLDRWGLGAQASALELVVSELVSNAVLHGAGAIQVELRSGGGQICLQVTDEGDPASPPRPVEAPGASDQPGGWGLRLVDQVADRWGAASDAGQTRVWAIKRTGQEGAEPDADRRSG